MLSTVKCPNQFLEISRFPKSVIRERFFSYHRSLFLLGKDFGAKIADTSTKLGNSVNSGLLKSIFVFQRRTKWA
ncbi:hypothetical protein CW304_07055 [Bacillus sp. UFRGS-B20]|nr:hypothetical protein CW304_07055 [Bacillus sp. UFRGS-B20]